MRRGVGRAWPRGALAAARLAVALALFLPAGQAGGPVAQAAAPSFRVRIPNVVDGVRAIVPAFSTPTRAGTLAFGVYPGGGTGEMGSRTRPSDELILRQLRQLSGGQSLVVHLYTAWSWHGDWLDAEIEKYSAAGFDVVLTVKYSPPAGRDGDVAGYESFVRSIVRKYAANPRLLALCIGNEANATGSPDASDGPFKNARLAVARGVVAAGQEVAAM